MILQILYTFRFFQCGIVCNNILCGLFSTNLFNIYNNNSRESPVGTIIRKSRGVDGNKGEVSRYYTINFPNEASTNEKLLLIYAVLMIDYRMYDTKVPPGGDI